MSKALSSWQKILNLIILLSKDKQLRQLGGLVFGFLVVAILWWLNWKLFLATSVGIGLMSLCYLLQNSYWQSYCRKWQKFLTGSNRQFILAVGAGATGSFCTYLAASVWADAENQWLATGEILQGFASITTLSILLWSLGRQQNNSTEVRLNKLLEDLSHRDPLKRLVAIRQLTRLLVGKSLTPEHYYQSQEYFRLMLSEPQLPVVQNALLESLELLDLQQVIQPKINPKRPEVRIPIKLHPSPQKLETLKD